VFVKFDFEIDLEEPGVDGGAGWCGTPEADHNTGYKPSFHLTQEPQASQHSLEFRCLKSMLVGF
jgi:hypothetical protein